MSLLKLLNWHYFTVQTNEGTANQDGALNRKDGWVSIYENLKGHLQAAPGHRNEEVLDFHIKELEVRFILFHNYTNKEIKTNKRILTWVNPKLPISDYNDKVNIRIFNIVDIKEPVAIRGKKTLFELHLEEILRPRQSV
jgi:hypothetical protein